ncbi:MAG: 3-phosphoshikimate 1-carboxyvinyltransferase [Epulopiscium sp. Nele67-Bin002]|nr:MAG: 3-phosphoshikimate 1-carboxyvinyltransferase [Epulopiscium sp. Nuni2H_MBin001]OON92588.1 MAG: 3-phosphoshikimate 1-carboxyvinyltransferase [Epulopiscium sp. Nele67-Bin002]
MHQVKILPTKLTGNIKIPPSKSMAHRAIICASLSTQTSVISGVDYSADIIATIEGMRALGADIVQDGSTLTICGEKLLNGGVDNKTIFCNESGSTLRFLVPISLVSHSKVKFTGKGNLGKRPLTSYYNIFDKQNIKYSYEADNLNLQVEGKLSADKFELAGDISSQFITGLLFALPLLESNSEIIITTPLESKGYVDLTLQMMESFGVYVQNNDYKSFIIEGNQTYKATTYEVEGDFSQAAFFLVAGAIGNNVTCTGMNIKSLQGDKMAIDFLREMGVDIQIEGDCISAKNTGVLNGITMSGAECPDIIPVMSVVAALCDGETEIVNAGRLRIKECDRLTATTQELNKIGALITENVNGMKIDGVDEFSGNCMVSSHKDHRIAMSLAIAATRCKQPIILDYPECVEKSYPKFWDDYKAIGGKVEVVIS